VDNTLVSLRGIEDISFGLKSNFKAGTALRRIEIFFGLGQLVNWDQVIHVERKAGGLTNIAMRQQWP
jgi:hypothetical protein